MFRILRTTRGDLLLGPRGRKYTIYALGELILVVAGILIALQINNWNDNRKASADALHYLDLLRRQLDVEIRSREQEISEMGERVAKIEAARQLLYADDWNDDEYDKFDELHRYMYAVDEGLDTQRPPVLGRLLEARSLDAIDSREIQEKLFTLDRAYGDAIEQSQTTYDIIMPITQALLAAIPYGTRENTTDLEVEPRFLLNNPQLKAAMRTIRNMQNHQLNELSRLQVASIEIRDDLYDYVSSHAD